MADIADRADIALDAERYRKLRAMALRPAGALEAFVAIEQLDYVRDAARFDKIVDEAKNG